MEISLLPSKTPSQSKKMTSAMKAKSDFMGEATRDKMSDLYDMIVALRNKVKALEKYHFEATEYDFVSYGDEKGEKKYATGKVRTTGEYITLNTSEYVEVEVIENSVEEFVGRKFYIISTAEENGKLYQLYVYDEETQILSADKLWVKLGEDTDEGSSDSGSSEPDDPEEPTDGEETLAEGQTYNFVSYADENGTTQYATGKVVTTGVTREYNGESYTEVEVTENSVEGFVGNKYYVPSNAQISNLFLSTNYYIQLYEYDEDGDVLNPIGIYVKITRPIQHIEPEGPGIGNLPISNDPFNGN